MTTRTPFSSSAIMAAETGPAPRVSIGLPVFNGERFLERALDSILSQSFEDMEVLLCDNASTDRTQEICRDYAASDRRVSFHPSEKNHGAAWNFNRSFQLARGEYFKWAAHDDYIEPAFVQRCVDVLDSRPEVLLCHARSVEIDGAGSFRRDLHCPTTIEAEAAPDRFRGVILEFHAAVLVFGLIRSDVLRHTPLIAPYVGSDWVLLGELALLGLMHELPEVLFWRTEHAETSQVAYPMTERLVWFDTSRGTALDLPHWKMALELRRAVRRLNLPVTDQNDCYHTIARYMAERRRDFGADLFHTTKRAFRKTRTGARLVDVLKRLYRGPSGAAGTVEGRAP